MSKSRFVHVLDGISKHAGNASRTFSIVLLLGMVLLITVDIIGRALGNATMVADEVSRYMLVGIIFVGLAHTQRAERHIEVDLLTRYLPQRLRGPLSLASLFIGTAFVWWLFIFTVPNVINNYTHHVTSLSYIDVPMWIPHLLVPLGLGLLAMQMTIELIKVLMRWK